MDLWIFLNWSIAIDGSIQGSITIIRNNGLRSNLDLIDIGIRRGRLRVRRGLSNQSEGQIYSRCLGNAASFIGFQLGHLHINYFACTKPSAQSDHQHCDANTCESIVFSSILRLISCVECIEHTSIQPSRLL
jgi:hypothetical protein